MKKYLFIVFIFFQCSAFYSLNAQEKKNAVINLKTGYSVKGDIMEQTDQSLKIRTIDGQVFEYRTDEIADKTEAKFSQPRYRKDIPLLVVKGEKILNLGIGLLGNLNYDSSYKPTIPPVTVSFEYIVVDNILNGKGALGAGGIVGYSAAKRDYSWAGEKINDSNLVIGARGYFHYGLVEKLDTYGGILLGYRSEMTTYKGNGLTDEKTTGSTPAFGIFAGCRYPISEKLSAMAELSVDISVFTIGVSVKL